ncbi:hypothetical protein [Maritimibacter sp. UBA3975]|uniref:hypothetical protein n=1 Tax=Maritimibacter sp. UBA3975 TaxID=1946833 RepID=UPI000C098AF6|nr:hypothetical protein [Maritimibacter sp. UBA3975]MAM62562.1 hypothetical protein [Maritimibacter sp.]|tara:strand:- start:6606 stop:7655 length:1050 start_codon:yes stop_codon:yes gene_type:complete
MRSRPYLSIVVVARNDDYGGDFLARVTFFARMLRRQAERHPDLFEVVVVNWNPLSDRPSIADAVDWHMNADVRIITVDRATHDSLAGGAKLPVLEFQGKNVGIKRARGDFILETNADIVFTDELMDFIAQRRLRDDAFYRADRYDFRDFPGRTGPVDAAYAEIGHHVFEVLARNKRYATGFADPATRKGTQPIEGEVLSHDGTVLTHDWSHDPHMPFLRYAVHNNAAGDFILASRAVWERMGGFWERVDTFTHLDSFIVYRARARGIVQVILRAPMAILHMDHSRADQASKPRTDEARVKNDTWECLRDRSKGYNAQKSWGLEHVTLPERRIARRPLGQMWERLVRRAG